MAHARPYHSTKLDVIFYDLGYRDGRMGYPPDISKVEDWYTMHSERYHFARFDQSIFVAYCIGFDNGFNDSKNLEAR